MKLKEMQEKRGQLAKDADNLQKKREEESRAYTPEERSQLEGILKEAEELNKDIELETRQMAVNAQKAPELSKSEERDLGKFDIAKVLRYMDKAHRGHANPLDGIEAEVIQQGEREAQSSGLETRGLALPDMVCRRSGITGERRDLSVTGGTTTQYGGELVATEKVGLLDDFYNASVMVEGGAMVLPGLVGNVDLPRYNAASDPAAKAENASADELSPTFTSLSMTPNRLPAVIDISDRLLAQSSVALLPFLQNALRRQLNAVQEKAFWHGTGTNEAEGVAATSGIGSVAGGTNGAAPDWADMIALIKAVGIDDALVGNLHFASNMDVWGKLSSTLRAASTDSMFILDDRANDRVRGYDWKWTNAIKNDLTKGSGTALSAIFFGNFSDYVVGYWGGLDLEIVTDKTLRTQGQRALVANVYYDGGLLRAESFSAMVDAVTTL